MTRIFFPTSIYPKDSHDVPLDDYSEILPLLRTIVTSESSSASFIPNTENGTITSAFLLTLAGTYSIVVYFNGSAVSSYIQTVTVFPGEPFFPSFRLVRNQFIIATSEIVDFIRIFRLNYGCQVAVSAKCCTDLKKWQTLTNFKAFVVPRLEATLGVCRRISGGTEVQLTDYIACSLLANLCMKRLIYLMFTMISSFAKSHNFFSMFMFGLSHNVNLNIKTIVLIFNCNLQ